MTILIIIFLLIYSHSQNKNVTWTSFYNNFVPCLVIVALNIFPEACHQQSKSKIMVFGVLVFLVVGFVWVGFIDFSTGMAIIVGTVSTAIQWVLQSLICVDTCRLRFIDACQFLRCPLCFYSILVDSTEVSRIVPEEYVELLGKHV